MAGLAVAVTSMLTLVPVLWLLAVADTASGSGVHRLAVASDLVDVLLFAMIGVLGGVLARAVSATWLKAFAVGVSVLAVGRAIEIVADTALLEVAAPIAFVALVALVSTLVLLGRSPISPR
jgi:hypothetical protein